MDKLKKTIEVLSAEKDYFDLGYEETLLDHCLFDENEFREYIKRFEDIFAVVDISFGNGTDFSEGHIILKIDDKFYKIPGWFSSYNESFDIDAIHETEQKTRLVTYWT